jgi:hypothetical protein
MGIASIQTSGTDKNNQLQSISAAIQGIPMQLQFEIRKIPAFQINTRILAVSGSEIKLQLGQNMGIKKGDEYSVIVGGMVEGFKDEREAGLIQIKDVGSEVSTGQVIYASGGTLAKDAQLREIPRLGVDFEPYLHIIQSPGDTTTGATVPGMRAVVSRGFYGFRPYVGIQIPLGQIWNFGTIFAIPVSVVAGGEYEMHLGRLTITPYGGVGVTYLYVSEAISGYGSDTNFFPHVGAQAYVNLSYLITRDMRIYAEGGYEYWLHISQFFADYGGLGLGAGVAFKL